MFQKINQQISAATKNKQTDLANVYKLVKADILTATKAKVAQTIDDQLCYEVIYRQLKSYQEALEIYQARKRESAISQKEFEIASLENLLPKQLSDSELTQLIDQKIIELGLKKEPASLGLVNKSLAVDLAGRVAPQRLSLAARKQILEPK